MLAIYRCCGVEIDNIKNFRPTGFDKIKCFKLFYEAYKNVADIIVVYDGDRTKLLDYIEMFPVKVNQIDYKSNLKSILYCYELANGRIWDTVCVQEDDYCIRREAGEVMKEGLLLYGLYTTYLHADRLLFPQNDITYGQDYRFLGSRCYHISMESTTGSFGMDRKIFEKIYPKLVHYNVNDRPLFRDLCKNNIRLFGSMPGLSAHCCVKPYDMMAGSFYNWNKLFECCNV